MTSLKCVSLRLDGNQTLRNSFPIPIAMRCTHLPGECTAASRKRVALVAEAKLTRILRRPTRNKIERARWIISKTSN